eukprot:jgi/Psemu1/314885/fgenesh1_kg.1749_\
MTTTFKRQHVTLLVFLTKNGDQMNAAVIDFDRLNFVFDQEGYSNGNQTTPFRAPFRAAF